MLREIPYRQALLRQKELVERRAAGALPDLAWYLEHPAVVTRNPARGDRWLKAPPAEFAARRIALEETDRGGEATYHAPGQLVGYVIADLSRPLKAQRDLHAYLRALEEALIRALAAHGLEGARVPGRTGVWVKGLKIAALGVRSSRWVTSHGFALNVRCDLAPFRELIIPCGIADAGVTSMVELLGSEKTPSPADLVPEVHRALEAALERPLALTWDGQEIINSFSKEERQVP